MRRARGARRRVAGAGPASWSWITKGTPRRSAARQAGVPVRAGGDEHVGAEAAEVQRRVEDRVREAARDGGERVGRGGGRVGLEGGGGAPRKREAEDGERRGARRRARSPRRRGPRAAARERDAEWVGVGGGVGEAAAEVEGAGGGARERGEGEASGAAEAARWIVRAVVLGEAR